MVWCRLGFDTRPLPPLLTIRSHRCSAVVRLLSSIGCTDSSSPPAGSGIISQISRRLGITEAADVDLVPSHSVPGSVVRFCLCSQPKRGGVVEILP